MDAWEDILRDGAKVLLHERPERLKHFILQEMKDLQSRSLIPSWENYKQTRHWNLVQRYFTKEEQFMYRCCYLKLFKASWPRI